MSVRTKANALQQVVRRPLFGSIWMALFALLREELIQPRARAQS